MTPGASPRAIDSPPKISDDPAIIRTRSQVWASAATRMPPTTMPAANAISRTARLNTLPCSSDGNERTTSSGVSVDGATISTNTIANSIRTHLTTPWSPT